MRPVHRRIPRVGVVLLVASACGAAKGPNDLVVADPAEAVRAARKMIDEQRADSTKHTDWISAEALPPSLRVPGLHHASVHEDHLDLVIDRNPDIEIGGRIWATPHRPHQDQATKYPDILFYSYNNDFPESPDNIH